MKSETEALQRGAPVDPRAAEWREQEGAPEGERVAKARTRSAAPGFDEVAERTELSRHLRLSTFPADREALLRDALDSNAPEDVLAELSELPGDRTYGTVYEVWEALGHQLEQVAGRPFRDAEGGDDGADES